MDVYNKKKYITPNKTLSHITIELSKRRDDNNNLINELTNKTKTKKEQKNK